MGLDKVKSAVQEIINTISKKWEEKYFTILSLFCLGVIALILIAVGFMLEGLYLQ